MKKLLIILTVVVAVSALGLTVAAEKSGNKSDLPISKTQLADVDQMIEQARVAIKARAGEEINWQVIASGGTDGSSASYNLKGTAGQLTVGEGSSDNYGLRHGYWQDFTTGGGGCCMGAIRGNVDYDPGDAIDISDLVYLVDFMFSGGPAPVCFEEGDVDGSNVAPIDISDLVYLVDYMFTGGPPPPACT
ncbi:MAG: hypothetical protein OEV49_07365 [candidate division Zixibacteria bacterium]|nr:hypothetical protein [candidate division Zixibacteria bacterium]MDH3938464.1 hypothetical protein [candidate division Zixibacteria bacterium]